MSAREMIGMSVAVLLALSVVGCSAPKQEPSGRIVKVGVIGPFSGSDVAVGKSALLGVELALAQRPLLMNGDRVELVVLDDASSPEGCADAYKEMADRDVVAVLVLSRSNSALALAHRTRIYRLPIIATVASHPELTEDNSYIVQLSPDDRFQGSAAAMFLRDEMLFNRAVVVEDASDLHAASLAAAFVHKFEGANGVVVDRFEFADGVTNLSARLVAWQRQKTRLVYAPVQAHKLLELLRGLKAMGWQPTVMAGDGALSEIILEYREELGLVEGLMATDVHGGESRRNPFGRALWDSYQSQEQRLGTTFTILGAEGMALLLQALDHTASPEDPREILEQLSQIHRFEGVAGILSVGDDRRVTRPVYVNIIRDSRLECLVRVY